LRDNLEGLKGKASDIEKKIKNVTKDLPKHDSHLVTTPDIEKIIEELKKIGDEISDLNKDINDFEGDVAEKEKEVEQFVRGYRGERLYEADKKLKEALGNMDELEKKLEELKGDMGDFDKTLNDSNDNPKDQERVNMINKLLKALKDLGGDRDGVDGKKDDTKNNLLEIGKKIDDQDKDNVDMDTVNALIKQIEDCNDKIKEGLGDCDNIEDALNKLKKNWDAFSDKYSEKRNLIEDFEKMLGDNRNALEELKKNKGEADNLVGGLSDVYSQMKDNPDYELAQKIIDKNIQGLDQNKIDLERIEGDKDTVEPKVESHEDALKKGLDNLDVPTLKKMIKEAEEVHDVIDKDNKELENMIKSLKKKRVKLEDADINVNANKRKDDMKKFEDSIKDTKEKLKDLMKTVEDS
jgi:chromosome segregation ATPase